MNSFIKIPTRRLFIVAISILFLTVMPMLVSCCSPHDSLAAASEEAPKNAPSPEPDIRKSERPFLVGVPKPKAEFWPNSNLRVEATFSEGQWALNATGSLPNSCYKFSHLEVRKLKNAEFEIVPYAVINHGGMCLMVITPLLVKLDLKEALSPRKNLRFFIKQGADSSSQVDITIPK